MFQKIVMVLLLLLSTEAMAKRQALLVGVADYKKDKNDLAGIEIDLNRMQKLLESWDFEVKILRDANSMKLDRYLTIYEELGKDDMFAFYYTGHGSHAKDDGHDEEDGEDETLVLSDGKQDIHYRDDDLNYRLNCIKAKKLIMFDSCHSGSAYKATNAKLQPKSMVSDWVKEVYYRIKNKLDPVQPKELKGSYLVLSASKDSETSQATKEGSLFTSEVYNFFTQDKYLAKSLDAIRKEITYNIGVVCKKNDVDKFHPVFSLSDGAVKETSMEEFLR